MCGSKFGEARLLGSLHRYLGTSKKQSKFLAGAKLNFPRGVPVSLHGIFGRRYDDLLERIFTGRHFCFASGHAKSLGQQ